MLFGNALDLGQALTNPIEGNTGNLGNFETQALLKQLPFFPGNVFFESKAGSLAPFLARIPLK